jgi:hypothetical protein
MAGAAQPGAAHCIMPAGRQKMRRAGAEWCVKPAGEQLDAQATSCHTSGGWPTAMISAVQSVKTYDHQHMNPTLANVGATATLHQSLPSRHTLHTGGFQQQHHCQPANHNIFLYANFSPNKLLNVLTASGHWSSCPSWLLTFADLKFAATLYPSQSLGFTLHLLM